ncbi:hypothetical protein J4Q44_G00174910 [Coregonus suidteri]|uniref:Uncharacterized protein n=1 Tax=Coregonus suidteri TaxID=861788 RepID=A0AAN8R3U3_9TELE
MEQNEEISPERKREREREGDCERDFTKRFNTITIFLGPRDRQTARVRMRTLLQCVALCVTISLCVCFDSQESTESFEDVFVSPFRANSFINPESPQRGSTYSTYRRTMKSPADLCHCRDKGTTLPVASLPIAMVTDTYLQRYFGARNPGTTGTRRF